MMLTTKSFGNEKAVVETDEVDAAISEVRVLSFANFEEEGRFSEV